MYIMIICHWAILHYNMSFKTTAGRSDGVFWWFPALSKDQEFFCWIHQNYLVALKFKSYRYQPHYWHEGTHVRFYLLLGNTSQDGFKDTLLIQIQHFQMHYKLHVFLPVMEEMKSLIPKCAKSTYQYWVINVITSLVDSHQGIHHYTVKNQKGANSISTLLVRPKIKFSFSGATFHSPLTKSATLNRLLHCSLWWFSGALFCISGAKSPGAPV